MFMRIQKNIRTQKGFTLVELMVVIAILGILAAIAVPKFANTTTVANTSKIAADLRTIDSAVAMYQVNSSSTTYPTATSDLDPYLAAYPTPPLNGQFYQATSANGSGSLTNILTTSNVYVLPTSTAPRATYNGAASDYFHK